MSASINPKSSQKKEKNVKKAILTKEKLQDLDISDEEALSDLMDNQSDHSIEEEEIQKEQKETDEIPLEEPDYEQEEPKDSTAIEKFMKDNAQKLDLTVINNKIQDILNILNNFTANRDQARSRESYVSEFAEYLCAYYGYNRELIDIFLMTFSANEVILFLLFLFICVP